MNVIGIAAGNVFPPIINKEQLSLPFKLRKRQIGWTGPRFAACLYRATQTRKGVWYWEKVRIVGETFTSRLQAFRDAQQIADDHFGGIRVYDRGLGQQKIEVAGFDGWNMNFKGHQFLRQLIT